MHMRWTRFKRYDISLFDTPCSDYDIPTPFFHVQTATFSSDNNNIRSGWSCLLEWIPVISSSFGPPPRCFWPLSCFFLDFDDNDFSDFFVYYYKPFLVNEGIVYISFWCDNRLMRFL